MVLSLFGVLAAAAQTATFSNITDALPGRCYDSVNTRPDPVDGNKLVIAIHSGISPQTWQNTACIASDAGFSPIQTSDTISFLVTAPEGFRINRISFTQAGTTYGSRGGMGFRSAMWVVGGVAATVPLITGGWSAAMVSADNSNTESWVSISTFLAAAGGSVRSGSATATNPVVTVELAPIE